MDAFAWDERYQSTDHLWSAGPNLFVADRLGPAEPGTGIDVAGGEGRNAIWLAKRGWKMSSVDFSSEAVARGEERSDEVDFVVADVLTWEPDQTVDLVLIAYLHLLPEEFGSMVKRSRGWLAPGGEIFMIGHDVSNIELGHGGPQYPEILWDRHVIVDHLEGLPILESQVVRRPVETDEGTAYALDALVRARQPH